MSDQAIENSLRTLGTRENGATVQQQMPLCFSVAIGESACAVALSLLLVKEGRGWPPLLVVSLAAAYHVGSIGMGLFFFNLLRKNLGRDHEPLVPMWLLRAFAPVLASPYIFAGVVAYVPNLADKPLWIAVLLVGSTPVIYGMLAMYVAALWIRNWITEQFELVSLQPVSGVELPPSIKKYFDERTPEFDEVDFALVGDFLQKPRQRQFARLFLGAERVAIGEIIALETNRMRAGSFMSLLSDGTFVETSDMKHPGHVPMEGRLVMLGSAGKTMPEVFAVHWEQIKDLCEERDCEPVPLDPRHFELVVQYGTWLCYEQLKAERVVCENPYAEMEADIRQGIDALIASAVGVAT